MKVSNIHSFTEGPLLTQFWLTWILRKFTPIFLEQKERVLKSRYKRDLNSISLIIF